MLVTIIFAGLFSGTKAQVLGNNVKQYEYFICTRAIVLLAYAFVACRLRFRDSRLRALLTPFNIELLIKLWSNLSGLG